MIRAFNAFPTGFTGAIPLPSNLLRLPLFEGLDVAALARITAGASEVNLRSGTVMFRRGDPCKGLFLLVQGKVKLSLHAPNGTEKVVELVGPGGCVGESTIARGRAHALTAETITETRLVYVAAAVAQEELKRTPLFGRRIIASLSERMHCLIAALEDCMLRSGTERVSGYLISQLPSDVERGAGAITLSVKKGIIASPLIGKPMPAFDAPILTDTSQRLTQESLRAPRAQRRHTACTRRAGIRPARNTG